MKQKSIIDWEKYMAEQKAKDELIKELEAEVKQHRWISVSKRLPKPRVKVLTVGGEEPPDNEIAPAVAWMGESGEWWTYGNATGFYKPTHWKPIILPE
jgi:hypothetical protein